MKNLIMVTFAVAMAMGAVAANSIKVSGQIIAYDAKDTNPSNDNRGNYSCYVMTVDTASTLMGSGAPTFDKDSTSNFYSYFTSWLKKNFETNSDAFKQNAESATCGMYFDGKYYYANTGTDSFNIDTYVLGVAFYDNGTDLAYYVTGDKSNTLSAYGLIYGSGWQPIEEVPEPTTGMLMIFGLMGLALKRKHT